jgi:8-oxo-dGTP pyrophosphatase MutT (NUDIX family)
VEDEMANGEDGDLRPDAPGSPWRTVGGREVYRNPWLTVTEYQVIRPDGKPGIYGVVDPGDNVTIVALEDDERVWLVSEFLYPLQTAEWFLPTGAVERGEDILAAAQRELAEETGLRAAEWMELGAYPLSPGISAQIGYIFLARGLRRGDAAPEGTEHITMRLAPLSEALEACLRNEIRATLAVIGIWRTWALLHETDGQN